MATSFAPIDSYPSPLRIAVIPRLIATLSYLIAAFGASFSAFFLVWRAAGHARRYFVAAALSFSSVGLLWVTESIFIEALYPGSTGISNVGSTIQSLLTVAMIAGPISALLLLIASVLPIKSKSQTRWPAILILVVIQCVLIAAAIAFQMRTSWLWRVMEAESFG